LETSYLKSEEYELKDHKWDVSLTFDKKSQFIHLSVRLIGKDYIIVKLKAIITNPNEGDDYDKLGDEIEITKTNQEIIFQKFIKKNNFLKYVDKEKNILLRIKIKKLKFNIEN
jgi:transposase